MTRVIKLGGRWFSPAEQTSSRQDGWVMVQFEDAGLLDFVSKAVDAKQVDESAGRRLVVEAMRSGVYHHIIAGLFVEKGSAWTPESAEKNALWFADLTAPEDKAEMLGAFVESLQRFFLNGVQSSPPLATSSTTAAAPGHSRSPRKRAVRSTAALADVGPTVRDGLQTATATT